MQIIFDSGSRITKEFLEFLLGQVKNESTEGVYIEVNANDPMGDSVAIVVTASKEE
jgi:hypothetical protein